jgi:hypothetical protein
MDPYISLRETAVGGRAPTQIDWGPPQRLHHVLRDVLPDPARHARADAGREAVVRAAVRSDPNTEPLAHTTFLGEDRFGLPRLCSKPLTVNTGAEVGDTKNRSRALAASGSPAVALTPAATFEPVVFWAGK